MQPISFLGYILTEEEVRMDLEKISAVTDWLVPTSRKHIRFLGFASFYRKFIRNFGSVTAPLQALTSSKIKFSQTSQADQAFQRLKECFTYTPVLSLCDPSKEFVVEVDASLG